MGKRMIRYTAKRALLAVALGSLLLFLIAGTAAAGLTVSGAMFRADVSPNEHLRHVMTVSLDQNDTPMDLMAEVFGFGQTLNGANLHLPPEMDTSPYTARAFLCDLSVKRFHLDPGESKRIILTGDVPKEIGPGGRYELVSIRGILPGATAAGGDAQSDIIPESSLLTGSQEANLQPFLVLIAVDVPVLLTVSGTHLEQTGEITNASIVEPVKGDRQHLAIVFKNTGNYHYRARASGVVKDGAGETVATATTDLSTTSILPISSRLFNLDFNPDTPLSDGTYTVTSKVLLDDGTVLSTEEITFAVNS